LISFVPEVRSTNETLGQRLVAGEHVPEGAWLVADRQTAGRGRQGRTWFDGNGNFMGSTVVHARFGDPALPSLSLVAGLAVHGALILPSPLVATVKWPNDVLVDGAKLAGILIERIGESAIVGIGVNLAAAPDVPGRRTASLAGFGAAPDRNAFAETLARSFDLELQRWRDFGLAPIVRRWLAVAHAEGTPLAVDLAGERFEGAFAGLDDGGALRLRLADGSVRVIHAGEVSLAAAEGIEDDAARD
jgi:BirA family biotin operon repressor/biotin-[acetyl-CoA-carboxylase] ligase